jgi:hypothetical protein
MRNLIQFIKNIWAFRKALWNFRWWDYHFTLDMMKTSLEIMSDTLETKGIEVDGPRMKKVDKMRRAIQIIDNTRNIEHIEMAEKELGKLHIKPIEFKDSVSNPGSYELVDNDTPEEKEHNKKVYDRAREIEDEEWKELWKIFEGQDTTKYKPKKQNWDDWFDGTGMRGWWD